MNNYLVFVHVVFSLSFLNRTHPLPLTQMGCVMLKIIWVKDHNVSLKPNKQAMRAEQFTEVFCSQSHDT